MFVYPNFGPNMGFSLVTVSIFWMCSTYAHCKSSLLLLNNKKASAYQHSRARLQIQERIDKNRCWEWNMCECDWERARATSTHSPSACLHLGLQWARLLKCGLINCVCTQPTQNYSWNFKAATLSEHFSHCLIASVDISLLLLSHVTTIRTKNILAQTVSHFSSYLPHTLGNCHSHSWEAVSFPSLCLFDVSFQPHPCKQWISKRG